ncbi:MAG TPA: FHA domain-containing protein [Solirubrobacteraceae bacterium]|nr:FHA domain-containing protein [Solirubrobacteraceae bacterium]
MESLTSGTFVGAGSFRCRQCGFILTLSGTDSLGECPSCGGQAFVRASLFGHKTERLQAGDAEQEPVLFRPASVNRDARLKTAREQIEEPGEYLCYEDGSAMRTVPLTREWTRIGRSLAADVRFDDPTVSRRHALIVRQADGVRLLDDRSLNGVFLNGERVDGQTLKDGDEIIIGRYRLMFVSLPGMGAQGPAEGSDPTSVHTVG